MRNSGAMALRRACRRSRRNGDRAQTPSGRYVRRTVGTGPAIVNQRSLAGTGTGPARWRHQAWRACARWRPAAQRAGRRIRRQVDRRGTGHRWSATSGCLPVIRRPALYACRPGCFAGAGHRAVVLGVRSAPSYGRPRTTPRPSCDSRRCRGRRAGTLHVFDLDAALAFGDVAVELAAVAAFDVGQHHHLSIGRADRGEHDAVGPAAGLPAPRRAPWLKRRFGLILLVDDVQQAALEQVLAVVADVTTCPPATTAETGDRRRLDAVHPDPRIPAPSERRAPALPGAPEGEGGLGDRQVAAREALLPTLIFWPPSGGLRIPSAGCAHAARLRKAAAIRRHGDVSSRIHWVRPGTDRSTGHVVPQDCRMRGTAVAHADRPAAPRGFRPAGGASLMHSAFQVLAGDRVLDLGGRQRGRGRRPASAGRAGRRHGSAGGSGCGAAMQRADPPSSSRPPWRNASAQNARRVNGMPASTNSAAAAEGRATPSTARARLRPALQPMPGLPRQWHQPFLPPCPATRSARRRFNAVAGKPASSLHPQPQAASIPAWRGRAQADRGIRIERGQQRLDLGRFGQGLRQQARQLGGNNNAVGSTSLRSPGTQAK